MSKMTFYFDDEPIGSMEEYNNWLLTKQKGSGNHE